jgi:hypothetical protein
MARCLIRLAAIAAAAAVLGAIVCGAVMTASPAQ